MERTRMRMSASCRGQNTVRGQLRQVGEPGSCLQRTAGARDLNQPGRRRELANLAPVTQSPVLSCPVHLQLGSVLCASPACRLFGTRNHVRLNHGPKDAAQLPHTPTPCAQSHEDQAAGAWILLGSR